MYAVTVEVPSAAPATVPTASASSAPRARGSVPRRMNPACEPTATSVPTESNSARKKNTKMTAAIPGANAPTTSSCKNVGANEGGRLAMPS